MIRPWLVEVAEGTAQWRTAQRWGQGGGTVMRWSKEGKRLSTINTGQMGPEKSLVVLPNGELLSAGADGTVKRWSVEAVAKRFCLDLQEHRVPRDHQTRPQRTSRDTCRLLSVLRV